MARVLTLQARSRRDDLVGQLVDLFLAEGFLAFGIGDLAGRLACSRSTLYLVAPSKEQIVTEVVRRFFLRAAESIDEQVASATVGPERIETYLLAVAEELTPVSDRFYADLIDHAPAHEIYRHHTTIAAQRLQEMIGDGVEAGTLRGAHAQFVGASVVEVMNAIAEGRIEAATGLSDAEAYRELVDLVLSSLRT